MTSQAHAMLPYLPSESSTCVWDRDVACKGDRIHHRLSFAEAFALGMEFLGSFTRIWLWRKDTKRISTVPRPEAPIQQPIKPDPVREFAQVSTH